MASRRGIKTINIVRDRPNYEALEEELLSLGATTVVKNDRFALPETQEYLRKVIGGSPILGFNCVGGMATAEMARFLADGSTLVTYGGMAGKNPTITASSLIFRDIKYAGFWMSRWYQQANNSPDLHQKRLEMFEELAQMFRDSILLPPKMERMTFNSNWRAAFERYANPEGATCRTSDAKPLFVFDQ